MKYGKQWKSWIESCTALQFPAKRILSYRDWKKKIVHDPEGTRAAWRDTLQSECTKIDKLARAGPVSLISSMICAKIPTSYSYRDQLQLMEWNAMTLYKICKKLQKKLMVPSMKWYTRCLSNHDFSFTGSAYRSWLSAQTNNEVVECPICCDTISDKNERSEWVFMRCGHITCVSCAKRMWKINDQKGTTYNLFAIANSYATCPVCRAHRPCHPSTCIVSGYPKL